MSQTICIAIPLLPGTTDNDRDEMLACWRGDRSEEHRACRVRHGITREATWIRLGPSLPGFVSVSASWKRRWRLRRS